MPPELCEISSGEKFVHGDGCKPACDGEGIARRDFSAQVKEKMLLAGFVLILLLMVTVIYNDLTRISWIERLMPWRN